MSPAPQIEIPAPPATDAFAPLRGLRNLPEALIRSHLLRRENGARRLDLLRLRSEGKLPDPSRPFKLHDRLRSATAELQLHDLYFENLSPQPTRLPEGLAHALSIGWGSFEAWRDEFRAYGRTGDVGWVILLMDPVDFQLSNHCVGLNGEGMPAGFLAVLVMDVKGHAFAGLDRSAYIEAFLENVDWACVEDRHALSKTLPGERTRPSEIPISASVA